jgi:integrase/recombinase XerD
MHENGVDIRIVQELMRHASIRTTQRYEHVSKRALGRVRSPLDSLDTLDDTEMDG